MITNRTIHFWVCAIAAVLVSCNSRSGDLADLEEADTILRPTDISVSKIFGEVDGVLDSENSTIQFEYNDKSQIVKILESFGGSIESEGELFVNEYRISYENNLVSRIEDVSVGRSWDLSYSGRDLVNVAYNNGFEVVDYRVTINPSSFLTITLFQGSTRLYSVDYESVETSNPRGGGIARSLIPRSISIANTTYDLSYVPQKRVGVYNDLDIDVDMYALGFMMGYIRNQDFLFSTYFMTPERLLGVTINNEEPMEVFQMEETTDEEVEKAKPTYTEINYRRPFQTIKYQLDIQYEEAENPFRVD